MIWWFYRQLKAFKLAPSPGRAAELKARFDRTRSPQKRAARRTRQGVVARTA
jgi:hypothetical protein